MSCQHGQKHVVSFLLQMIYVLSITDDTTQCTLSQIACLLDLQITPHIQDGRLAPSWHCTEATSHCRLHLQNCILMQPEYSALMHTAH
jgi:hypothetical protein